MRVLHYLIGGLDNYRGLTMERIKHRKVLVVEDNGDSALALKLLLEAFGFSVAVAGDGEIGLMVARAWAPDFVLLDISLPGMDGYAVSEHLRGDERTARTTIIANVRRRPAFRQDW